MLSKPSRLAHIILFCLLAEHPMHDKSKQRKLFKQHKPSPPPKEETKEFKLLEDFCRNVQYIIQVVNENEYQAAVTLMKPPDTLFKKAVVFPNPGFMIGMFANKKTALIHTSEGADCSDYVQDTISYFPKAQFVIGIGIGYAFDSTLYRLGDVLISKQICDFNLNFKNSEIIDTGQRIDVVEDLSVIFCTNLTHEDFKVSDKKRCANAYAGQFASLSANIESQKVRDRIHCSLPEAIGGDMEGGELLKFQWKREIKGVGVIKGVSHYADGSRTVEWEFTASLAALHYANSKLLAYQSKIIVWYKDCQ